MELTNAALPEAGNMSLRRCRLGGCIEKGGVGEILISAPCVLQHDINGLGAGINPGKRSPGTALPEASLGQGCSRALRCNGLLKGKGMKVSGTVPGRLNVAGLLARQLTYGFLREVANTAVSTTIEKHLAPGEQVLGSAEESAIHREIAAAGAPGEVAHFLRFPFAFLGLAMFPDRSVLGHVLVILFVRIFICQQGAQGFRPRGLCPPKRFRCGADGQESQFLSTPSWGKVSAPEAFQLFR